MRLALAAAFLLAACSRRNGAEGAACPHDPSFDRSKFVRVRADSPPAVLVRDLDIAALTKRTAAASMPGRSQGLTEVEHQLRFASKVNFEAARGRTCVWMQEVVIDLTPSAVRILIPREYPDGSCEYDAILAHEREHERVHAERLAAAAEEIRAALTDAKWLPARGNPLETADQKEAEAALNEKIRKVVTPAYAKYKDDLAAAQADLDRPDLYQWVSKRCTGWK